MLITLVKVNVGNSAHLHEVFVNAAHIVSMDVRRRLRCQKYDYNGSEIVIDDLVVSLVNGKEWTLPYSEGVFNQGAFDQWRAYVRQDHLNQIDKEAKEDDDGYR